MPTDNAVKKQAEVYLAPFVSSVEIHGLSLEALSPLVLCAITLHRTGGAAKIEKRISELTEQIREAEQSSDIPNIAEPLKLRIAELRSQFPASLHAEQRLAEAGWIFDAEKGKIKARNDSGRGHPATTLPRFCVQQLFGWLVTSIESAKTGKAIRQQILSVLEQFFPELDDNAIRRAIDDRKTRARNAK